MDLINQKFLILKYWTGLFGSFNIPAVCDSDKKIKMEIKNLAKIAETFIKKG